VRGVRPNYLAGARILERVPELDSVRYATTRNKHVMTTNSQNVQTANHITWRGLSTRPTAIDTPVLVPLPAYGTRLRGIGFVHLYCTTGFIVQLRNQPGVTRTANLLRLPCAQTLCGIIEWLTHIAGGAWERLGHFARGLMHYITQAAMRFRECREAGSGAHHGCGHPGSCI
jgi:hypothetical protein